MVAIRKAYIMESLAAENRELNRLYARAQAQVHVLSNVASRVGAGELAGHAYRAYSTYLRAWKIPSVRAQADAVWALMRANSQNMAALSALQGAVGGVIDTDELQARKHRIDTMMLDLLELAGGGAGAVVGLVDPAAGKEIADGARRLAESLGDTSREIQQMIEAALRYAATCSRYYAYAQHVATYAGKLVRHVSVASSATFVNAGMRAAMFSSLSSMRFRPLRIVGAKIDWNQKFFTDTKIIDDDFVFYIDPAGAEDGEGPISVEADHFWTSWVGPRPNEGAQDEGADPVRLETRVPPMTGPGGIGAHRLRELFEEQGWTWPVFNIHDLPVLLPPHRRLIELVIDPAILRYGAESDDVQVGPFQLFDAAERGSLQSEARRILDAAGDTGQGAVVRLGEGGAAISAADFGRNAIARLDEDTPVVVLVGGEDAADSASWTEALAVGYEKDYATDDTGHPSISGVTLELIDPADPAGTENVLHIDFASGAWSAHLHGADHAQSGASILYASVVEIPSLVA